MNVLSALSPLLLLCLVFAPAGVSAQERVSACSPVYVLPEKAMKEIPDASVRATKNDDGWQHNSERSGIKRFRKTIPETSTRAFKGVCVVDSPLKTVFEVITDVNHHSDWVKFCRSSLLVSVATPLDSIQYYSFDIPWPFADRDIVVNTRTEADWESGIITITGKAARQSDIPVKKGCVRLTESDQQWILEKITPTSTRVTFTSYIPLRGSVPKIIRNIISDVIPFSTLKSVKQISIRKYMDAKERFVADSNAGSPEENSVN